ncbi:Repeat domain-containing protein [Bacteroides luti]|uniref:Repeat domain-containing protein n=1 Tax=Bacteroides luti TaxID=1297750 RepID=A0A1M4WCP2_9BACE|nr:VCBS repeat-containing protein [Bacteroides luti]SHE78920.1 Repeat domain-containing protein [Bacteroides luti]
MNNDFNGDSKADILVTSPWGLGILSLTNSKLTLHRMYPNGSRFGGWLLNTKDNYVEIKADFDGDGRTEVLMSSPWGIGILKLLNGNLTSIAMGQNGSRHGGWLINTADNQFLYAADFDKDGKKEILVTSPWGIGLLKYANNDFSSLMLSPNGSRFGDWLLNTADNYFTLVGDFDGDKQTEIIVTSPWGLGVLKFNGSTLNSIAMVANNTNIGGWVLNTAIDRFEVAGDFDGDGKAEILVSNSNGIGILKLQGNTLSTLCMHKTGTKLGNWVLDSKKDKMNITGDFDKDGKLDILITSNWGLGVLKLKGNTLQSTVMAANGTRFGGWLLNTRDNRINYVADFDGDGIPEIQITSPWGIGILKQSGGTFNAITMLPNGTRIGGWLLNTADNDFEAGIGQSYGLIIYHSQWQNSVNTTTSFLRNRGYTMFVIPNATNGITILKQLSLYLRAGDRLFVYLAGHGGSSRALGDTTKSVSLSHIFQFEDGMIVGYDQFAPSFELLGNKGVDLSVFDGSCDAGESVLNAIGEKYLAMSTTSVYAPGITDTPNPSEIMQLFGKPNKFGMWWSSYYTASLLTSKAPHRFHQKIYRNDNTEINTQSLFYKPAIPFYASLGGGWDLMVRHCYLYQYIYTTEFNTMSAEEKAKITETTADYLASMKADYNAFSPSILHLKNILSNTSIINAAANIYTGAFPRPWQTIFGDMNWDVVADPIRHTSLNNELKPGSYTGTEGFIRMVNEILNLLFLLEQSYTKQEVFLNQIDAKIKQKGLYSGIFKKQPLPVKKITDYLIYNQYENKRTVETNNILNNLNIDRTQLFKNLGESPRNIKMEEIATNFTDANISVISKSIIKNIYGSDTLNELIANLKSLLLEDSVYLDKLFYLLTIVEEAISKAQSTNAECGDLVSY